MWPADFLTLTLKFYWCCHWLSCGDMQGDDQTVGGLLHSLGLGKYSITFQAEEVNLLSPKSSWSTMMTQAYSLDRNWWQTDFCCSKFLTAFINVWADWVTSDIDVYVMRWNMFSVGTNDFSFYLCWNWCCAMWFLYVDCVWCVRKDAAHK
jgi:hypothetical protein